MIQEHVQAVLRVLADLVHGGATRGPDLGANRHGDVQPRVGLFPARRADLDCLIVDVYLGGMSGSDLHAELAAAGEAPPTVLVTAHDDAAIAAVLRRSEDLLCLHKPFDDSSLLFAIGCVTGRLDETGP